MCLGICVLSFRTSSVVRLVLAAVSGTFDYDALINFCQVNLDQVFVLYRVIGGGQIRGVRAAGAKASLSKVAGTYSYTAYLRRPRIWRFEVPATRASRI